MTATCGTILIAGSGFLADAYGLYVIGLAQTVLFEAYPVASEDEEKELKSIITTTALVGAMVGQILFGFLADKMGRKRIFICTGFLIVLGAVLSASAQPNLVPAFGPHQIFYQVAAAQLVMGFGIGGEYPLSAAIASESSSAEQRGRTMALVFSMQGLGYLVAALVNLILVSCGASADVTWRFCLGFGGVLPAISLYFRLRMHETQAFSRATAAANALNTSNPQGREQESQQGAAALMWEYRWHVIGTASAWCIFDIVFYANSLFHNDITALLGTATVQQEARSTLVIVLIMLPGYWAAIFWLDRLGRKGMQALGFLMMAILFGICGNFYDELKSNAWLFVSMYGLTFFFSNLGPNTTTYVVPGEIYPTRIKASCHGLSAASGKFGAALGTFCFPYLDLGHASGLKTAMLACSSVAVFGFLCTVLLTPAYDAMDLEPTEADLVAGRSVHFVPLRCQQFSSSSDPTMERRSMLELPSV